MIFELKLLSCRPGGQFLVHLDSSPMTKLTFSSVIKRCLSQLGLSHSTFSSHFYCIGAATEAARLGIRDVVIMKLGRWESQV